MNHFYSVFCECVYCEAALLCCDRMTRHQIWRWRRERLVPWGLIFFFSAKTHRALEPSTRHSASLTVARNLIHSRKHVKYRWRSSFRIEADLLAVAFMSSWERPIACEGKWRSSRGKRGRNSALLGVSFFFFFLVFFLFFFFCENFIKLVLACGSPWLAEFRHIPGLIYIIAAQWEHLK